MEPPCSDTEEERSDNEFSLLEPIADKPKRKKKREFILFQTFPNQEEAEAMIQSEKTWRRSTAAYKAKDSISTTYECNKVKPAIKIKCKAHLKLVKMLHSGEFSLFKSGYHNHDEIEMKYLSGQKPRKYMPENVKARIKYYVNCGVTQVNDMIGNLQRDGLYSPEYKNFQIKRFIIENKNKMK